MAVVSHETAIANTTEVGPHDPARANHLKRYRWQKGDPSLNPGGRPRKLPVSDRLREILEMPLPTLLHAKLETAIGGQALPKKLTFGDGVAFATVLATFGAKPS